MKKLIAVVAVLVPSVALAAQPITDFNSLTSKLTGIGNAVIGIFIAVAVIWIVWNTVSFIINAGDETKRAEKRSAVIWGLIGLAIILSIWGIVAVITNTFYTGSNGQPPAQNFPTNPVPPPVQ